MIEGALSSGPILLGRMIGVCLAAIVLLRAAPARADGIYIPEQAVPALPAIPTQRAMIIYRDGQETLVVESTFQSPKRDVGWILPVPAEPTKLELGEPGMLTSLSMSLRPSVTHDLTLDLHGLVVLMVLLFPAVMLIVFLSFSAFLRLTFSLVLVVFAGPALAASIFTSPRMSEFTILLLSLTMAAALGILLRLIHVIRNAREFYAGLGLLGYYLLLLLANPPTFAGRTPEPMDLPDVAVSSSQRLGNYQVDVLRAQDAHALSEWLSDNDLAPLSDQATPIVNNYIARNWRFLVSRIRSTTDGLATPPPIAATFPASAPVFPMMLTALANTTAHVELMVVANQEAQASGFHCVAADRFVERTIPGNGRSSPTPDVTKFDAVNTPLIIGSPQAGAWMWDGCTVTKLVADMAPSDMTQDISIALKRLSVHQDHVFSTQGRNQIALEILLFGAFAMAAYFSYIFRGGHEPSRTQLIRLSSLGGLIVTAALVVFVALPVVSVQSVDGRTQLVGTTNILAGLDFLAGVGTLTPNMDQDQWNAVHAQLQTWKRDTNPYTGEPRKMEASPGNFTLETIDGQKYVSTYDENGVEIMDAYP
jgi:hypothetical protein